MEHDRSLCHECKDDGMCDGQAAYDCEIMNLSEFETILNDRMMKLDDQFATINEILKTKKEAFIKLYRKDPRKSLDKAVVHFQKYIENYDASTPEVPKLEAVETVETTPISESKETIICDRFSDDNKNVIVSSCKLLSKVDDYKLGYCLLNHQKIEKNKILKWSLRVPKFKYGWIGTVIFLE